jgi:sterol desaturase/sphingolipid hydroxylase (fatty acid hydroxylase superfamily)
MYRSVISYFQTLEEHPLQRLAFLIGGMLFFWILEGAIPLVKLQYNKSKSKHATVNLVFTLIHLVIHTLLAFLIIRLSDWCMAHNFGLVYWLHADIMVSILISLFILDFFGGWLVHFTEHKMALLWRFHLIHHADNKVDVTTGLRHHPGESLLRGIFFFIGILVSGSPMYAVMIFQTVLVLSTAFTHANIRLPGKLDTILSYILVSPNMHKVHHHWKQPYTDSNYGAIFSIWDRLLRTFRKLPYQNIRYGLDRFYPNEKDEDIMALLKSPFRKNS